MHTEHQVQGLSVAQMATLTGVSADTLRYYERAGLIARVTRNAGNQRRYQQSDVEWIRFLLRLRETGMPIAGMRRYAALRERGESTVAERMELLHDHQQRLRDQLRVLRAHDRALDHKIATYAQMLADSDAPTKPRSKGPHE